MPAPIIHNKKPVAICPRDGLNFVQTTATLPLRKDSTDDLYHISRAPFKAHR